MRSSAPSFSEPQYKEVRFSHPLVRMRRTQSVPSSNPVHRSAYAAQRSSDEFAAYIEQSQSLLESQRISFEQERIVFAQERKLWEIERAMLKSRIAQLESMGPGPFQPSSRNPESRRTDTQHHVWEGPVAGLRRPTRVFPEETYNTDLHIPPTEANGFGFRSSLDAALSPQLFRPAEATVPVPVPIEKVDSQLDGITLKSTALPPDVVAKVMTPPTSLSPSSSPPKGEADSSKQATDGRSPLRLQLSDLGPPADNLTRDAGHTPMAILGTETDLSTRSPSVAADDEGALAPVVTKQPVEDGESYFPPIVDDDPALQGPLSLRNDADLDSSFLSVLDKKLLDEAKKAVSGPSDADNDATESKDSEEEPDIELKLKSSTNFGTVFGQVE